MRLIAGPNGSGKSTLFEFLQKETNFPLGYCLNPDLVEAEIRDDGRLDFKPWGLSIDDAEFQSFLSNHPLRPTLGAQSPVVAENVLSVVVERPIGYFAAVLCDFLRQNGSRLGKALPAKR
jgi:hypothetical protein